MESKLTVLYQDLKVVKKERMKERKKKERKKESKKKTDRRK